MNRLIRDIATQTDIWCDQNGAVKAAEWEEKFAELIIRECIGAVDIPKHLNGEAEDYFREAAQLIRNHFGVES